MPSGFDSHAVQFVLETSFIPSRFLHMLQTIQPASRESDSQPQSVVKGELLSESLRVILLYISDIFLDTTLSR